MIGSFVDRVERGVIEKRKAVKRDWAERLQKAQESVPNAAYELPLETLGLSDQILQLLTDEEFINVGDLMLQMEMDPEKINKINGIGPKAMENIQSAIEVLTSVMPKDEEPLIEAVTDSEAEIAEEISADKGEISLEVGISEKEEEEIDKGIDILEDLEDMEQQVTEKTPDVGSGDLDKSVVVADISEDGPQPSLEEIFDIQPELLDIDLDDDDDEDELIDKTRKRTTSKKKKKKGHQKKYVDIEYDPDADVTLYHKRRKSDEDDWEDDVWDY
jgi:hypothetical protein